MLPAAKASPVFRVTVNKKPTWRNWNLKYSRSLLAPGLATSDHNFLKKKFQPPKKFHY